MGKLRALLLVFCLIYSPLTATAQKVAQKGPGTLQPGTPVERQLGPGQTQEFTVDLEENNLIQLVVEQKSIDVIVKTFTPSGKSIGEYDSPNGNDGPENVSFVAASAGNYRIAVSPLDPWDTTTGRYQIKIVEVRPASDQELAVTRNLGAIKARGIALLKDVEEIVPQIKSPYTRIKTQLSVGNILWEIDEKLAAKFFSDAMTGFKEFLASLDPDDNYFQSYSTMSQLRYELIQSMATKDPESALNFLHATQTSDRAVDPRERAMQETSVELAIAEQMARKDPVRAIKLARQNLKKGLSPNLINTIRQLRQQNPEMAVEFANEIAGKLCNEKLLKSTEAATLAAGLLQVSRRWTMKFEGSENATPRTPLLTDDQFKELVQKMLTEALSYSPPERVSHTPERDSAFNLLSGLRTLGPTIETFMPGGEAAVLKKLADMNNYTLQGVEFHHQLQTAIASGSTEASLATIAKAPTELREQYYMQLAQQLVNTGDIERAKQIVNDHISTPYQRRQFLNGLEQQKISQAMNKGKVEEALRTLQGFRNTRERAQQLTNIVHQIGPGQKRASALNLLEQARGMLNPSVQALDQDQMNALLEIARAFSRYDSKRAFEILDPLIDQFNELSEAARTLDGFGLENFEEGELNFHNGGSVSMVAYNLSRVLAALALTNFDQAKAAADRIRLTEVRLKVYVDIAEQALLTAK